MKRNQAAAEQIAELNTNIYIGGLNNPETEVIQVPLYVVAKVQEANAINNLVEQINQVVINGMKLNKQALRQLTQHINALVQYPSIKRGSQFLQNLRAGLAQFFLNEVNRMPRNETEVGHLGYEAYQEQMLIIHKVIRSFNRTLTLVKLPELTEPIVLQLFPRAPSPLPYQARRLPATLDEFASSIALNDACKEVWEHHFQEYHTSYLQTYFESVLREVQKLSVDSSERAGKLLTKLADFCKCLDENHFCVEVMRDIAKFSVSPVKTVRRRIPSVQTSTQVAEVREGGISQAVDTSYKASYNQLIQLLSTYVYQSHNVLLNFRTFQTHLLSMLRQYPMKKYELLPKVRQELGVYDNQDKKRARIKYYLSRLERRIQHDIPEHSKRVLTQLKTEYDKSSSTARQQLKLRFFEDLEREIHEHPERTYHECVDGVKQAPQSLYTALFQANSIFNMGSHNFRDWVQTLETLEPEKSLEAELRAC